MPDAQHVAQAYARWIADGEPEFQAMMSPDLHDHVSGRRGPETWDMVWSWIERSFEERRAELHGWGTLDDGRIAVWVTLHGRHIGSGMPWLGDRPPSGAQIAWKQLHVFAVRDDRLTDHWAVRDDRGVIEAVDAANAEAGTDVTGNLDGTSDAGDLRDLLTDHRGELDPSTVRHGDDVLEHWDGRRITAEEVHQTLVGLRRELGLPERP